MAEWTFTNLEIFRKNLEEASARILGRMIFEYSRLDMELGLLLAWSNDGENLQSLTKKVSAYNFSRRLEFFSNLATEKYQDEPAKLGVIKHWIDDANVLRDQRNSFIHGRWSTDPTAGQVINVIGLPTGKQVEYRYTLPELKLAYKRMQQLRQELVLIRARLPF